MAAGSGYWLFPCDGGQQHPCFEVIVGRNCKNHRSQSAGPIEQKPAEALTRRAAADDVTRAVPPMPVAKRVMAFEMPTVSYAVLAAQLDLAEQATGPTIPQHSAERLETSRLNLLATELAKPAAADV